ncbi:MAG TPA: CIA30 family protein [Polyangiaceae bacterium]|nr:CIA30 family protein [Polyangiaceae bacterium]
MKLCVRSSLAWVLGCLVSGLALAACVTQGAPGSTAPSGTNAASGQAAAGNASVGPAEKWLVENFEGSSGLSGNLNLEFDKNNIGTVVETAPFKIDPQGSPESPKGAGHVKGALGANRAPWSWVQLQVYLDKSGSPKDLTKFKSLRFMVKGDGGRYNVSLIKKNISDFDHYHFTFTAKAGWTEIKVPLDKFTQAGWGKPVKNVFDDVVMIQFSPAEFDKPFEFAVDDVSLSGEAVSLVPVAYKTEGWLEYSGTDPVKRRGSALDMSRLLDAPAGKHGWLGHKGESFVFKDGKPARFIGVNIVASANFPTHEQADKIAELLAEMGVNLTRHHHMDADWATPNLFDNKKNTGELGKEALERFDYLIAQLQKRGIYQFFDLIVHRKPYPDDKIEAPEDVAAGYKIEGEFDPKLIALQEKLTTQLFSHENPYTKKRYAQDPAIAGLEVINEDSLFWLQKEGEFAITSKHYQGELNRQFGQWLLKKFGNRAALEKRWKESAGQGLGADEDPLKGTVNGVVPFSDDSWKKLSKARAADTLAFYYDTMLSYFQRMEGALRKLGYQGLVTGSNHWTDLPLDLKMNAELGFIDRHAYWAHPSGGWGYAGVSFEPGAMVKDPNLGIIGSLVQKRVAGLPYTVTEWQTAAPNDYRIEGLLIMGAIAAYQGWHPLEFAFSHDINNKPDAAGTLASNFDVIHQPNFQALWPAVALMFHRGDVKEATQSGFLKVDEAALSDPGSHLRSIKQWPLAMKGGIDFKAGQSAAELDKAVQARLKGSRITSPDGQLSHDPVAGIFQVNTPRTQGFVGFKPQGKLELANLSVTLDSDFAVLLASALTDEPIASAKRVLITAAGNAVNSGMKLDPSGGRVADVGKAPILAETIRGGVTLSNLSGSLDKVKLFALSPNGERVKEVALQKSGNALSFKLEAKNRALSYELVRE